MSAYITEKELNDNFDLPIALPNTKLHRADWLIIATVTLPANARLSMRFLSLELLGINLASPHTLINAGLGLAYVGLYRDYTNIGSTPVNPLESNVNVGTSGTDPSALPLLASRDVSSAYETTTAGNYSVVVVNNTSDRDLQLSANGQLRIDMSAA